MAIAVAVEGLGVAGLRHHRIRAEEPPQGGIVVSGSIIEQVGGTVKPLAGEVERGGQGGRVARTDGTVGEVAQPGVGRLAAAGSREQGDCTTRGRGRLPPGAAQITGPSAPGQRSGSNRRVCSVNLKRLCYYIHTPCIIKINPPMGIQVAIFPSLTTKEPLPTIQHLFEPF